MSSGLVAAPGRGRRVDAVTWFWGGAGLLFVLAMTWILLGRPRAVEDPLTARVTQALRGACGPGVRVLRCESARGVWAGPQAVPFRCQVFVDGRRAGEGLGVIDPAAGQWTMYYDYADRVSGEPGQHRTGSIGGPLWPEAAVMAIAD